jgi:hypothetical protein
VLVRADPDRFDEPGIYSGQVPPLNDRSGWNFEEVEDLTDPQAVIASFDLEDDDGTLIGGTPILLQQQVAIEYGQQAAPDVHQPFNRIRNTRYTGSRKAREDLTHDPCRGRADNLTDPKDDGVERGGVSHVY